MKVDHIGMKEIWINQEMLEIKFKPKIDTNSFLLSGSWCWNLMFNYLYAYMDRFLNIVMETCLYMYVKDLTTVLCNLLIQISILLLYIIILIYPVTHTTLTYKDIPKTYQHHYPRKLKVNVLYIQYTNSNGQKTP